MGKIPQVFRYLDAYPERSVESCILFSGRIKSLKQKMLKSKLL